jgi:nucleoside-diphosphate-sugar epimerase
MHPWENEPQMLSQAEIACKNFFEYTSLASQSQLQRRPLSPHRFQEFLPINVFLTGATGFIGSHLAQALHERGHRLRCLVRKSSNLVWLQGLPVEYVYGDLFDEHVLREAVKGVDYVYHLAGLTKAKTSEEYFRGNHLATKNLLEAVEQANPQLNRFVHMSSLAAVGPGTGGRPVDEETPYHPITAYGRSKMESENECRERRDRLPVTIVRPPAVYGPRDRDVFEFFRTMNMRLHPLIGFRDKTVSLIHVRDLVQGTILAGEHPRSAGQTYFISSERFYNWHEVGAVTTRIMNKRAFRVHIPHAAVYTIAACAELLSLFSSKAAVLNLEKARDIIQRDWTCSVAKAREELGFHEQISLDRGIAETVAWYKQQGWL